MRAKESVSGAVGTARPYVERLAQDDELHGHVKSAYESARRIYDELLGERPTRTTAAIRLAQDKDLQNELKTAIEELRLAGRRAQGRDSHTGRNVTLLLAGIAVGVLFNPATGPDTRRWIRTKLFGPEQPYEYQSTQS